MLNTVRAIVKEGRIELLEQIEVSDGTELLVTVLPNDESEFWSAASYRSLEAVWGHTEDDVYAELLEA